MKLITAYAATVLVVAATALAEEKPVPLAEGPGRDLVEQNCASCHSLDYIRINAPFPDAKLWEAEVAKMINAFGAPIDPKDAKPIADYLAKHYGK
jgi:mono/diheme cytochrome c family protein